MINFIYRLILTLNATSWMVVIYGIKEHWHIQNLPAWVAGIGLLLIPVVLSILSILTSALFGKDTIKRCQECNLADNEFLPVYLGYFFVSLSINDLPTLLFLYGIIFVFTFLSQTQYFNPTFLLFGYHFYHITTEQGTKVFVIHRGRIIRRGNEMSFNNLRRINDTTYIAWKEL